MSIPIQQPGYLEPTAEFHLLGRVDFARCLTLQHRLAYEADGRDQRRIDVLLCEHPPLITVGRSGSRVQVRMTRDELTRRQLSIRWVGRGGGCLLHMPGQLAVYPIVPLALFGWTVGDYMRRLQAGIVTALASLHVQTATHENTFAVFGRSGPLAVTGVAVRNWTTFHGAFVNVNPAMTHFGFVDVLPQNVAPDEKTTMGSLLAERRRPVKMTEVRAALVEHLAQSFDCRRSHLYTGHPLLAEMPQRKESA